MIAVRKGGRVAVAADSLWSDGYDKQLRVEPKIRVRNSTVVTVGPTSGFSTALQYQVLDFIRVHGEDWSCRWPEHCLSQKEGTVLRRLDDKKVDAPILVVDEGNIYTLWCSGEIFQHEDDIVSIGCGGEYAEGAALTLLQFRSDPEAVARASAMVACELSAMCCAPIISYVL